jgi:S-adenosylmethionine:tRNA ribosyltransferase-isomerase
LKTDLFDYSLPAHLIAQKPADRRDESRLLVIHRLNRTVEHRQFRDLPDYLHAGDCLFRNNAAVIPARLHAQRPTGGQVECLLLRPSQILRPAEPGDVKALQGGTRPPDGLAQCATEKTHPEAAFHPSQIHRSDIAQDEWWCLLRPGKKLPVGATFGRNGIFTATVREKTADGLVRVGFAMAAGDILAVANRIGEMPLPPYIAGRANDAERNIDRERYQTVYADRGHQVAAAAPTAGLHFTPELLGRLAAQGVASADLTLHVGLGTFRPIATEHIEAHDIHHEVYEIPASTQQALFTTKGRRIAVGTTSVRTIEDFCTRHSSPLDRDFLGEADIFIYPPRELRRVDALITNFHQPRSTLLCLVAAFLTPGSTEGVPWLKEIYAEAVARNYRFFSYGDAMLIV